MSYFSRATFNARSRDEIKSLNRLRAQPYLQHQELWRLYRQKNGANQPFLFRELADPASNQVQFFLVSAEPPASTDSAWKIESKVFDPQLLEGQAYQFSVRLNPTRSERVSGERGKRQDLVISRLHELAVPPDRRAEERQRIIHEELPRWLSKRGERHGFTLEDCAVQSFEILRVRKDAHEITLSVADFSGRLRVTDPDALKVALCSGIGHGRSFGLGLMLLRRAQSTGLE